LKQTISNMELPKLEDLDVRGKKVLVRADLDLVTEEEESYRLEALLPTLKFLIGKDAKIIVIGHRGRPGGKEDESLSLQPVSKLLEDMIKKTLPKDLDMNMMENLRFNKGEEENDEHYAEHLAESADCYVNEAFAVSHRKHASIVGIPKYLPHAAGIRFREEIDNLNKVLKEPTKPVVMVISGKKEDKISYLKSFDKFADKILVAGRLPVHLEDEVDLPVSMQKGKILVAKLIPDKEDITLNSIERFEEEIKDAGTVVVSGPIGRFEDDGHRQGTERVLKAITNSNAFKVAGGGETQKAISSFGLEGKFDWISVGGGAMLEFLAHGTLPGIEALLN
jgi:phosphoglycerate kinase